MDESQAQAEALFKEGLVLFQAGHLKAALLKLETTLPLFQAMGDRCKQASCLLAIGVVRGRLGDYTGALNAYEASLPLWQAISDLAMKAETLNGIGEVYRNLGQYQKALDNLQQALAIQHDIRDWAAAGTTLNNIGGVYYAQGQYQEALGCFLQTLAIFQNMDDPAGEGTALNSIAAVYYSLGQYQRALAPYKQALTISQNLQDREGKGKTLNNIGLVYNSLGQYQKALDSLQQALAIFQDSGNRAGEGTTFNNIGVVYRDLEQYERTLSAYQQALDIHQEVGDRAEEGKTLNNIGEVYNSLGQYQQALDNYYKPALTIFQQIGNWAAVGTTLNNMGEVYRNLEQYHLALESYEQALAIAQNIGDRRGEGMTLNNIGVVCSKLQQSQLAQEFYQKALVIREDIGDLDGKGTTLNNIGAVYYAQGRCQKALDYFQQALAIFRDIGEREGEASTLANIGFVYKSQGNTAFAINFYQQAIKVREDIQGDFKIEELTALFADGWSEIYASLIGLLWADGRFLEAFNYVERSKARAFLDQLANGPRDLRAGGSAKLLSQEQALKNEITALRTQLVKLRNRPSNQWDTDALAAIQHQLSDREKDYTHLLTQLKLQNLELASLVSVDVATLEEIQRLLDADTTLVEYFVTDQHTLVFIITRNTFKNVALGISQEDLTETIEAFLEFDLDPKGNPHPDSLQQLHGWLITPLTPWLDNSQLVIAPHGVLHYLPFAVLTNGERYLSDNYTLVTLPSASVLRFLPEKRKPDADTLLVLGNPTINEPGLHTLRFAEQEVKAIASLYSTQALVGPAATESAVWSQAGEAGILHIAAHGKYNRYNPLFSAVYLTEDIQHDGRLEVHDIYRLDLTRATNLVTLSACQTQVGQLSKGDEIVALNRAFLYAGTPTVMASLWSVDDRATSLLMERFYTHLRAGMGKAEALRHAQQEVRKEYEHPYYWAAFTLTGDGGR